MVELNNCRLEALALFNIEDKLIYANQSFYHLFGYDEAEPPVGNSLDSLMDIKEPNQKSSTWLKQQKEWAGKVTGIRKNNTSFSLTINFYTINPDLNSSAATDLHSIVLCSPLSKNDELDCKAILEQQPFGLMLVDKAARVIEVNAALLHLLDYPTPGDVIGVNTLTFLPFKLASISEVVSQGLAEGFLTANQTSITNHTYISKNGKKKYLELHLLPWHSGSPNPVVMGLQLIIRDITKERKRSEKHLYYQKMDTVARMANGVAHDFNNILTVITGYADILQESLEDTDPLKRSIQLIAKASLKANDFIKQLLTIGKRFPLRNEIIDVNAVINNLRDKLEELLGSGNNLYLQLDEQLWDIEGDKEQFEQVLTTLITNAKVNLTGRGQIAVTTQNRVIIETSDEYIYDEVAKGEYIMLTIKDNGQEMDEDTLSRLFEPFSAIKEKDKNLGISLAKTYGVISQMRGYILPYSEAGKGNTIQIFLPSLESSIEHMVKKDRRSLGSGRKEPLTILVVDDEIDISNFIRNALMVPKFNYRISEAANGRVALDICNHLHNKPDILITDVVMPYMNGVDLYDKLKKTYPELKVLFISGYSNDALQAYNNSLSRMNFLEKPFTASQLLHRLEDLISSS